MLQHVFLCQQQPITRCSSFTPSPPPRRITEAERHQSYSRKTNHNLGDFREENFVYDIKGVIIKGEVDRSDLRWRNVTSQIPKLKPIG